MAVLIDGGASGGALGRSLASKHSVVRDRAVLLKPPLTAMAGLFRSPKYKYSLFFPPAAPSASLAPWSLPAAPFIPLLVTLYDFIPRVPFVVSPSALSLVLFKDTKGASVDRAATEPHT